MTAATFSTAEASNPASREHSGTVEPGDFARFAGSGKRSTASADELARPSTSRTTRPTAGRRRHDPEAARLDPAGDRVRARPRRARRPRPRHGRSRPPPAASRGRSDRRARSLLPAPDGPRSATPRQPPRQSRATAVAWRGWQSPRRGCRRPAGRPRSARRRSRRRRPDRFSAGPRRRAPRRSGARSTGPGPSWPRRPCPWAGRCRTARTPSPGSRAECRGRRPRRHVHRSVRVDVVAVSVTPHLAAGRAERAGVVDQVAEHLTQRPVPAHDPDGVSGGAARSTPRLARLVEPAHRRRRCRSAARSGRSARGRSRDSSASRREALEMSVISRSSRRTSCCSRPVSVSRWAVGLDQIGRVSSAERIEVRGFLISCATSAAKAVRWRPSGPTGCRSWSPASGPGRRSRPCGPPGRAGRWRGPAAAAPASAAADSRITGRATNRCSSSEASRFTARATRANGIRAAALGVQDLVDVAGLQRQHAQHLPHMADRDGDGDDAVAAFADRGRRPGVRRPGPRRSRRPGRARALLELGGCRFGVSGRSGGGGRAGGSRRRQGLARRSASVTSIAVGDQQAVHVEQPRPLARAG